MFRLYSIYIVVVLFGNATLKAEPWIDTSNLFLKAKIQLLADQGYIKTPVTTYPLMWGDIANDLKNINFSLLNETNKNAVTYINHQLKLAQKNLTKLEVNVSLNDNRFTSFGDAFRTKNNISLHKSFITDSFAMKIASTYSNSPIDGESKSRFDGSYIATYLGNWVFSVGKQDRWWGQGWDSNLSLTNNARPVTALAVSRKSAIPFTIPFTEIDIPWTVTSYMGIMDDNRIIKDTLLWGFRLNFKPLDNLEIGITRLAQWGGEGRNQNASTFWNLLIGKDNCGAGGLDCSSDQEPGNQQAGYDLRYSLTLFDVPIAIFGQYFAEDGDNSSSFSFLTEPKYQVGIDSQLSLFGNPSRLFIEYSDTYADCRDISGVNIGDCFYEHHTYQTGMRYKQRTIGSLYDNDASVFVLGLITDFKNDMLLTLKVRSMTLNKDNHDKAPDSLIIGNPLSKVKEDIIMLSSKFQYSYKNWRYTLDADVSQSRFVDDYLNDNNVNLAVNVEYNF
ncbi:capsule assembly Wzi family protein [Thalassotalea piscium]